MGDQVAVFTASLCEAAFSVASMLLVQLRF